MADARPRKDLKILSCTEIRRGGGGDKKEWVIYAVLAANTDGIPIDLELRSWTKLEATDKVQTFEIEVGDYKGTAQYTLHLVRTIKVPERVEILERKFLEMSERISRLESQDEVGEALPAESEPAEQGAGTW